jgi:hypothetical protein
MLKVPSQITKVETTSDGEMKLAIHANELDSATKAELMERSQKKIFLMSR